MLQRFQLRCVETIFSGHSSANSAAPQQQTRPGAMPPHKARELSAPSSPSTTPILPPRSGGRTGAGVARLSTDVAVRCTGCFTRQHASSPTSTSRLLSALVPHSTFRSSIFTSHTSYFTVCRQQTLATPGRPLRRSYCRVLWYILPLRPCGPYALCPAHNSLYGPKTGVVRGGDDCGARNGAKACGGAAPAEREPRAGPLQRA